jgi:hypothetical protein
MCTLGLTSSGTINGRRFVSQVGSSDGVVVQSSNPFVDIFGVSDDAVYTTGTKMNVITDEYFDVECGATFNAGDLLTTDSVGRAIAATLPGHKIYGKAVYGGTVGEKIQVMKYQATLGDYQSNIGIYSSAGTFKAGYSTIDLAIAALATNDILKIKAGSYTLGASCVITKAGVQINGEPGTEILLGATNCFSIVLPAQSGTSEISFNNLSIDHGAGVGIQVNNTSNTKKLIININNCEFSNSSSSVSVDIDHADTGNAIRLYANNSTFEGAVNMVTANDSDRMRFEYCVMRGGVVTNAGNYDLEMLFKHCTILHGGISGGHSNQRCIYVNCVSETDADPNVYALVDADDNVGSAIDQIIGS